ncbi:response regulator [Simplicispira suum]|uniref:Response regulatory domain-containing protein n=1 Tax=Simplicispira suum TaxID=2109915 RepID=A0A2S0N328_9BURK|nr:response regulator [Simplicispira suum]AVO42535.1 hypothetical protein C6571_15635 [Simplicispira suum]
MIKILLVEDEQEKRRLISSALLSCEGITLDNIVRATDAHEAKRQISKQKFDLLILDINIPRRADDQIAVGGGLGKR